jgi:hypothetical protein
LSLVRVKALNILCKRFWMFNLHFEQKIVFRTIIQYAQRLCLVQGITNFKYPLLVISRWKRGFRHALVITSKMNKVTNLNKNIPLFRNITVL